MESGVDPVLAEHRAILKREMTKALACRTKVQKRKLAKAWEEAYSPTMVQTLLRCARDKDAARKIADWNLINWTRQS